MVSRNSKYAILATIIYSDIFDFPLTKEELWQFLICKTNISQEEFNTALKKNSQIIQNNGLFCLKGRENIIKKRLTQKTEYAKKIAIAKRAAYYISYIPAIKLIGISGSLAIGNAKKEDDIDFFIIIQKNTIWISRIWILAILEAMNLRRKRTQRKAPDKICCNLLIEEDNLTWDAKKQNIYIAHEIIQMKPLFERQEMYKKFLKANQWVNRYFPNFQYNKQPSLPIRQPKEYYILKIIHFVSTLDPFKKLAEISQKTYMKKHQTKEVIRANFLALHPHDYAVNTIRLFNRALKKYGL
jgi:hypothetical protein